MKQMLEFICKVCINAYTKYVYICYTYPCFSKLLKLANYTDSDKHAISSSVLPITS